MEAEFPYKYEPLYADEIRLFHLDAIEDGDSDDLRGSLVTFRLLSDETHDTFPQEIGLRTDIPLACANYDALSYCWGAAPHSSRIKLYDYSNNYQGSIQITLVLEEALVQFRSLLGEEPHSRYFWIDKVCIDQANAVEKGHQIQKMAAIYDQAFHVRVWLGPGTESSTVAMDFVDQLVRIGDIDQLTKDPGTLIQWTAFMDLMQLPWFNRRWIIQELALAREPIVHCGDRTVTWKDFTYAVDIFLAKAVKLRKLLKRSPLTHNDAEYLGELDALGAKTLVECATGLFLKDERGNVVEHYYSLERLLASLTMFESSNPLDTFYAIMWLAYDATPRAKQAAQRRPQNAITPVGSLSPRPASTDEERQTKSPTEITEPAASMLRPPDLAGMLPMSPTSARAHGGLFVPPPSKRGTRDGTQPSSAQQKAEKHIMTTPPKQFNVDYEKSVFEVCKDFLEFAIRNSRSLDIICTPWAPKPDDAKPPQPSMPSWIPTVADRVYQRTEGSNIFARVRADPLVGDLGPRGRPYRASGKQRAYNTQSEKENFTNDRSLTTIGFMLDEVHELSDTSLFGGIPESWLDLAQWNGYDNDLPEEFWRTLVANKGPDGYTSPPAYFSLACKWAFASRTPKQGVSTNRLLNPKGDKECPELAFKFLRRVQAVIWNRKLVCTAGVANADGPDFEVRPLLVLAPANTAKGDLVCILYGCSVPVVLRKKASGTASEAASRRQRPSPRKRRQDKLPPPKRPRKRPSLAIDPNTLAGTGQHFAKLPGSEFPELDGTPITAGNSTPGIGITSSSPPPLSRFSTSGSPPQAIPIKNISELPEDMALKGGRYEFIGQCYVHGYMNGEAFVHQERTRNPLREFVLV